MPLQKSSHPSSYHQTSNRNKLLSPSQVVFFFENFSTPHKVGGGGESENYGVKQIPVGLLFRHTQKINSYFISDLRYQTFRSYLIWSIESIFGNNSGPRILPLMEFGMRSELSQWFSFQAFFLQKKYTEPIFKVSCPNMSKNEFSAKIRPCQFLDNKRK